MTRRSFLAFLTLSGFSLVSGCSTVNLPKDSLVLSLGSDPVTLNPILASDSASLSVIDFLFNGIIRVDEDQKIQPDLAESIKILNNGLVYRIVLRKDVYFHDGVRLTADDVVFTYEKILDPKTNTVRRSDMVVDNVPIKVIKVDNFTLDFVLPGVFSPFISNLGIGILPKHILENQDINTSDFNRMPIGTGPFIMKKWQVADKILLESNKRYYRGKPLLNSLIMKIIPDSSSQVFSYETGDIDMVDLRPKDVAWIKEDPTSTVVSYPIKAYTYLGFNLKNRLFEDRNVRVAIAHAIDKDALVKAVLMGYGGVLNYPTCPLDWSYPEGLWYPEYNPEKADEILDSAGWKRGSNGLRYKNNQPFRFTCLIRQGSKDREMAGVIIQQYLEKRGIKMDLVTLEWSSLLQRLTSEKKDFDATIMGWGLGIDPDPYGIWYSKEYPNGFNLNGYNNPEVDRLIILGRQTIDQEKRKKIYRKVYKIIVQDQPYVFLWYPKSIVAYRNWVKGLSKPNPSGLIVYPERIYVERIRG
ncbi:peptide/nickel transport system substrate-binding protein [Thermodesulfobium acidiphilum]|uniref:Peptide/nickel transport system substrate-binding protein n=1 Tax=Thermodesulfobium acidiphilum TaxID=1794699 RepID=A0A2R4W218_THEAF|nr:peptide-binding protein [Thermodesulfobium acidiphilum]AWB10738.1 peptide/nickel transport system substrate-binding protein [Thermodesulfobium acidiphilum]